jgi:thioredoxin-like negative regulator of GroEL
MKQVLYFSSTYCGPCRTFKPIMESLQTEMSITFINTDSSPQTAQQYNVRSVPTTIVLENGVEKRRLVGVKSKEEIISAYNS